MHPQSPIHTGELALVVALPAEATPLMGLFSLKRVQHHTAFTVYQSACRHVHLIISGTGLLNAAAATAYLAAQLKSPKSTSFCNIGIAGGLQELGSLWQCHKVTDVTTGRRSYPTLQHHDIASIALSTHHGVQTDYPSDGLVDLEGAGFFGAANRFTSTEQISVLKIVSDCDSATRAQIQPKTVSALIQSQCARIQGHLKYYQRIAQQEHARQAKPQYYEDVLMAIRCSVTQQHQLKLLLQRWQVAFAQTNPLTQIESRDARQFIAALKNRLENATYHWD